MRLGILVSGRGSNLAAVLDAAVPDVEPVLVISNRPDIPALEVAARHRVPAVVLRRSAFPDAGSRDGAIGAALADVGADLALLAGYDQVLRGEFFRAFPGRTLNIHPSLLPAHGGAGMIGLEVHRSVMEAGDTETGVTIHEVTPDLDSGPIVAQARVAVRPGEDAESLAARVLEEEHRLLVSTLARLASTPPADLRPAARTGAIRHDAC